MATNESAGGRQALLSFLENQISVVELARHLECLSINLTNTGGNAEHNSKGCTETVHKTRLQHSKKEGRKNENTFKNSNNNTNIEDTIVSKNDRLKNVRPKTLRKTTQSQLEALTHHCGKCQGYLCTQLYTPNRPNIGPPSSSYFPCERKGCGGRRRTCYRQPQIKIPVNRTRSRCQGRRYNNAFPRNVKSDCSFQPHGQDRTTNNCLDTKSRDITFGTRIHLQDRRNNQGTYAHAQGVNTSKSLVCQSPLPKIEDSVVLPLPLANQYPLLCRPAKGIHDGFEIILPSYHLRNFKFDCTDCKTKGCCCSFVGAASKLKGTAQKVNLLDVNLSFMDKDDNDRNNSKVASLRQSRPRSRSNARRTAAAPAKYGGKVVRVEGDGRCLFRSLAVCVAPVLQATKRDDYGSPVCNGIEKKETKSADDLRARLVVYMSLNRNDYKELGTEILNADQPRKLFKTFDDRLKAMARPNTFPGDLELSALATVIRRPILVVNSDLHYVCMYGEERFPKRAVCAVRFTQIASDVGHYDAVILTNDVIGDKCRSRKVSEVKDDDRAASYVSEVTGSEVTGSGAHQSSGAFQNICVDDSLKAKETPTWTKSTLDLLRQMCVFFLGTKEPRLMAKAERNHNRDPHMMGIAHASPPRYVIGAASPHRYVINRTKERASMAKQKKKNVSFKRMPRKARHKCHSRKKPRATSVSKKRTLVLKRAKTHRNKNVNAVRRQLKSAKKNKSVVLKRKNTNSVRNTKTTHGNTRRNKTKKPQIYVKPNWIKRQRVRKKMSNSLKKKKTRSGKLDSQQSRSRKRKRSESQTRITKRHKLSRDSTKRQPLKSVTKRLASLLKKKPMSSQKKKKSNTVKSKKQASIKKKQTTSTKRKSKLISRRRKLSKLNTGSKARREVSKTNTKNFKIVTLDKTACMMCATKTASSKALTCFVCDQVAHRACAVEESSCWRNSGTHFICDVCLF